MVVTIIPVCEFDKAFFVDYFVKNDFIHFALLVMMYLYILKIY